MHWPSSALAVQCMLPMRCMLTMQCTDQRTTLNSYCFLLQVTWSVPYYVLRRWPAAECQRCGLQERLGDGGMDGGGLGLARSGALDCQSAGQPMRLAFGCMTLKGVSGRE